MSEKFINRIGQRVIIFDGAMGTNIQSLDLDLEDDFWNKENCTEVLVLSRPDMVQQIHASFFEAGSDASETNTFGGMKHVLAEFGLENRCRELNRKAVQIARETADAYSTSQKSRFVVGAMGPGTKLISLGQINWDDLYDSYLEQARGLIDGHPDAILLETQQDILCVKCALNAVFDAMEEQGTQPALEPGDDGIPIMVQVTIEETGTMLTGTDIGTAAVALQNFPIISMGINCATGPDGMTEHVKWLADHWPRHISVLPNAGLPSLVEGETVYPLQPEDFAEKMTQFVADFGLDVVGGCCGTKPEHLRALVNAVEGQDVHQHEKKGIPIGCTSLFSTVAYRQESSLLNIGERCNASGSRHFKRLLEDGNWDEIISLAREQIAQGSHVLDINVDYAGRDNAADMEMIVRMMSRQIDAPLMLDSTKPETIEAGLRCAAGKCLINSANLENGESDFGKMCRLAHRYNAGLVLGTIDEDPEEAMARTEERKIEIARRMFKLATEKYGLAKEDLIFDPLVLPVSTGMEKDKLSALETIEGTRRIAEEFPDCQITCGLSNVSFGLKPAARQVLNSAFLRELEKNGMTSAIVHVSKIIPRSKVDDELWNAALDVIYARQPEEPVELVDGSETTDPLQIFIDKFPDEDGEIPVKQDISQLPLEERLQKHIIDGEKKNLHATLNEAMEKYAPLDIINNHLLAGMKIVGDLFGSGQMQLPFVLQSAEVMKMAFTYLNPYMEKKEDSTKGTIVLATVKGDVHDIGKNLVDIILTNNGYKTVNLGIKQPIADIFQACEQHDANAIGMSGLLVKSVNVMEDNLKYLIQQRITAPVLVGGAALSRDYCESYLREIYAAGGGKIYYAKDAFEGLRLMDHIVGGKTDILEQEIASRLENKQRANTSTGTEGKETSDKTAPELRTEPISEPSEPGLIPEPPFLGSRVVQNVPLEDFVPYINRMALYSRQWQFKKKGLDGDEYEKLIRETATPLFNSLIERCHKENILQPALVYGYYRCNSDGNDLLIYDPQKDDDVLERFRFPRQTEQQHLCISDFFRPVDSGEKDVIAMTCVTIGQHVADTAHELFARDDYQEYLYLHGLGVESAEGLAEYWHKRIREELNIADTDADDPQKMLRGKYRGARYSFGYPACPDLSDEAKLFGLIQPERIGCTLNENYQIEPEQSTSAIIAHHPDAKYFKV
ncbi:MAG: methionine synthase [Planctomycetes bacterium]|nr:methionine synthase [Planctomycetota bacterium]